MPTSSCIDRPKRRKYIVIQEHIRDFFEGDVCSAAVLSVLEYFTNGELDRQEAKEKPVGDPWIEISKRAFCDQMIGLFGKTAVLERLDRFVGWGILKREPAGDGVPNRYLLNFEFVNALLASHHTLSEIGRVPEVEVSETGRDPVQKQTPPRPEMATPSKEEESSCIENNPEGREEVDLPQDLDNDSSPGETEEPATFAEVRDQILALYREHRRHKPSLWGKAGESVGELIELYGLPYVAKVLDKYLALDDRDLHKNRHSIATFCRGFSRYALLPQNPNGNGKALTPAAGAALPAVTHAEIPPAAPAGDNGHSGPILPVPCVMWNNTVTAGEPVEDWTKRDASLREAMEDPDFLAKLPKILERCQAARQGNEEMTRHVNFRWLLRKNKAGEAENWYDVLNGSLAWARAKAPTPGRGKSAGALAVEEARARLRERRNAAQ